MPDDQLTTSQKGYIFYLLKKLGVTFEEILTECDQIDVDELDELTKAQASEVIDYLKAEAGE